MVHIALVGCGGMAHSHIQTLLKIPEVRIVAVVDPVQSLTSSFKQRYAHDAREYASLDALLADRPPALDAVVLVTPHTMHFAQATQALQAGLHVLVEKPMVTNSDHAYELWRTVNRTNRHLAIGFQAPYTAHYRYIQSLRDSGAIGKPQIVQGWLAQGWLTASRGTWRQDPALSGGGQMYDSGAHVLNGMMCLMNEPVVEVACMHDTCGSPVDINGVAIMRFQSGAMGSVAIGGNSPGWNVRVSLQTDKLQIVTGPHGGFIEFHGSDQFNTPQLPTSSDPAAFTAHQNFVNVILGRETLVSPVRMGVLLSVLMDALYESADRRTIVQVKPVPMTL